MAYNRTYTPKNQQPPQSSNVLAKPALEYDQVMALVKSNPSSNEDLVQMKNQLREGTHYLVPDAYVMREFNPNAVVISVVKLGFEDFYKPSKNDEKYCIHAQALKRIAKAAGIVFTASTTKNMIINEQTGHPQLVEKEVRYKVRTLTGEWEEGVQTGTWNDVGNPDIKEKKKASQRAETNAYYRAIRDCISNLKNTYNRDELDKAFVVARIVPDDKRLMDMVPEDKRGDIYEDYARKHLGLPIGGARTEHSALPKNNSKSLNAPEDSPQLPEHFNEEEPGIDDAEEHEESPDIDLSGFTEAEVLTAVSKFNEQMTRKELIRSTDVIMQLINYDRKSGAPLESFSDEKLKKFIERFQPEASEIFQKINEGGDDEPAL